MQGKLENAPHCPKCDHLLDGFTGLDHDKKPKAGDLTICAYCTCYLCFDEKLTYEVITDEEFGAFSSTLKRQLQEGRDLMIDFKKLKKEDKNVKRPS